MRGEHTIGKRWLIVDDEVEDRAALTLAVEDLGGIPHVATSLVQAEKLVRENIFDYCLLDYVFKPDPGRRGDSLVPVLRRALPNLPILMVSSHPDPTLPMRALEVGADAFVPKVQDSLTLMRLLAAASAQALVARRLITLRDSFGTERTSELYLTPEVVTALEISARRRFDRILIRGRSGTGKTSCVARLAAQHLSLHHAATSRAIVTLDALLLDSEALKREFLASASVGAGSGERLRLNALERAQGGVLVLENVQALPYDLQAHLKSLFESAQERGSFEPVSSARWDSFRLILTASFDEESEFLPGFLDAMSDREVVLPSVEELREQRGTIVDFLVGAEKQGWSLRFSPDFCAGLSERLSSLAREANFRSLRRVVRDAGSKALADGRLVVEAHDLPGLPQRPTSQSSSFSPEIQRILQDPDGPKLLEMLGNGGNLEMVKELSKRILFRTVYEKCAGKKASMGEILGLARQSVYRLEEEVSLDKFDA